jgi:putative ABC transport system substrate-binding protein
MNLDNPVERDLANELETIASARHLKLRIVGAGDADAVDRALDQARQQAQAFVVAADPIIGRKRRQITEFAAKHRLPAIYGMREFVDMGGLISYGPNVSDMFRRAAVYVDKILKGAKPGDLPIEQPTKFELVVNLKTAKALGITIPQSILLRADEVIR